MEYNSKYNSEWFKKRALESLTQIVPHKWDYSDSLLLYISSSAIEGYEAMQDTNAAYFKLITKPERDYLQSIAKDVVDVLPNKFEYIDLGPGTEHKEQFFFDELKRQGKEFTYIPVDISEYYLKRAVQHANDQGIPVRPVQASFEEVAEILGEPTVPRFVSIGLTFSNYEPQVILSLLKGIAGQKGICFINAQMRDRVAMNALQKEYATDSVTLADDKLKLLGLDPSFDVTPRKTDDGIRAWCSIINPSKELLERGLIKGDELLVFESLRYTLEQLETEIKKSSTKFQLFDTGSSFIASVIKV
ncbi:MAG: L-histidine N(alpha)-methyltransferase [Patescibacteria group bacterium]